MNKVYIVSSDSYSDHYIGAVFKDRAKAEAYCKCHKCCEVLDFDFSDDNIYTIFNYADIYYSIYFNEDLDNKLDIQFGRLTKEDDDYYNKNSTSVSINDNRLTIILTRQLPEVYDEDKIREKYTKILHDLHAEVEYMLSEQDTSSCEKTRIAEDNILKAIESKLWIEEE